MKGTHPTKFALIWFRGFRGEDLNVKFYDVRRRTPSDGKSSHGLWPGELKSYVSYLLWVRVMVFNATFNNISAISGHLVLLVEETGVPGENH